MIVNYRARQISVLGRPPHRLVRRPTPHSAGTTKARWALGRHREASNRLRSWCAARFLQALWGVSFDSPHADKCFQFRVGVQYSCSVLRFV